MNFLRILPLQHGATADATSCFPNDDGYFAPGSLRVAQALARWADITVVAPERDRSGAVQFADAGPAPCCCARRGAGFTTSTARRPYLRASGGHRHRWITCPNMVLLPASITVPHGRRHDLFRYRCAATEGYLLGIPAIACRSPVTMPSISIRCRVVADLVRRIQAQPPAEPMLAHGQRGGLWAGRTGWHQGDPVGRSATSRIGGENHQPAAARRVYWVGAAGRLPTRARATDFFAVAQGQVVDHPAANGFDPLQQMDRRERMAETLTSRAGIGMTSAAHAPAAWSNAWRAGHPRTKWCCRRNERGTRHLFVDRRWSRAPTKDTALPIGFGQTISNPTLWADGWSWPGMRSRTRASNSVVC